MRKSEFSEEQFIAILREQEAGLSKCMIRYFEIEADDAIEMPEKINI